MTDLLDEATLVGLLARFVRQPSQQTDLLEAEPEVLGFIRDGVAPLIEGAGLTPRFDAMGNLVLELGPGGTGRSLMFVTYAMTHPAAAMRDPFDGGVIETSRGPAVRGRGVAEQKTALAAALGAVLAAARDGALGGRLVFALVTAGETGRHDAVRSVLASLAEPPTAAVVCIGTGSRAATGNKGRVDLELSVRGRAAHSSAPWLGVNAIAGAWRVLERLEALDLGVPAHPAFGPATLTPTAIESGPRATHTIQDHVRLTLDRRLLPGENPEAAFARLRAAVSLEPPWTLDWRQGAVMYPNELSVAGPLYRGVAAAFAAAGLGSPDPFPCNFALDAGLFGRAGIEALMLGPGEVGQFHSDEETVLVADLVGMARVYRHLIGHLLSPA